MICRTKGFEQTEQIKDVYPQIETHHMELELTYLGKSIQREKELPPPPLSAKTSDIVHNNIVSLIHTCPKVLNLGNDSLRLENQVSLLWPRAEA